MHLRPVCKGIASFCGDSSDFYCNNSEVWPVTGTGKQPAELLRCDLERRLSTCVRCLPLLLSYWWRSYPRQPQQRRPGELTRDGGTVLRKSCARGSERRFNGFDSSIAPPERRAQAMGSRSALTLALRWPGRDSWPERAARHRRMRCGSSISHEAPASTSMTLVLAAARRRRAAGARIR